MPTRAIPTPQILVLHDPATLEHRTVELLGSKLIPALECSQRIINILASLREDGLSIREIHQELCSVEDVNGLIQLLEASHEKGYLHFLKNVHAQWVAKNLIEKDECILPECFPHNRLASSSAAKLTVPPTDIFARPGYYSFDMSAAIGEHTWKSALASANLAVEAAKIIITNEQKSLSKEEKSTIFALCRPPGHHCTTRLAGGYCYINNAVVAVYALRRFHRASHPGSSPRIAILDLDFHHGNGTQDHFYCDDTVHYASIHGRDEYPYYSGAENETGDGRGIGYNLNLPLPGGSTIADYLPVLRQAVKAIEDYMPHYLIISLGFDTFHLDPLGNFKIYTEDYAEIAACVQSSQDLASLPSIILLEGGYALGELGDNACHFIRGWGTQSG